MSDLAMKWELQELSHKAVTSSSQKTRLNALIGILTVVQGLIQSMTDAKVELSFKLDGEETGKTASRNPAPAGATKRHHGGMPELTYVQLRVLHRLTEGCTLEQRARAVAYTLIAPDGRRTSVNGGDGDALSGYGFITGRQERTGVFDFQLTAAGHAAVRDTITP